MSVRALLLLPAGCAPFLGEADLKDRADPCALASYERPARDLLRATRPCEARLVVTGTPDLAAVGGALAAVGDLDGDDVDDLVVGAPEASGGTGRVDVFTSAARASDAFLRADEAIVRLSGTMPYDRFGQAFVSLSNRDGQAGRELAVGAPGDAVAGPGAGAVFVVTTGELFAGSFLEAASVRTRLSGGSRSRAGTSLTVVDSNDGDAFEELVIGAPYSSLDSSQGGALHVAHSATFPLFSHGDLRADAAALTYVSADCHLGASLATYDFEPGAAVRRGLLTGAPEHPSDDWFLWGQVNWGRAWLFGDGGVPPAGALRPVLEPYSAWAVNLRAEEVFSFVEEEIVVRDDDARIGVAVAVVPDMDGGGFDELVLGGAFAGPEDVVAFVVRGEDVVGRVGEIFLVEERAVVRLVGGPPGARRAPTLVGVGDLDGDGRGELLVGDPQADAEDRQNAGSVHVLTSGTLFPEGAAEGQRVVGLDAATTVLWGESPGAAFGTAAAEVGDLDGDGRPEVAVGAPGELDRDGQPVGRVFVF